MENLQENFPGKIDQSEKLRTYPPPSSPNPTLALTCYQLTAVGIGKGLVRYAVAQMLILI